MREVVQRGLLFEELEQDTLYRHRPGRTMTEADNGFGGAGSAGPIAEPVLVFTLYDFFTSITALGEARIAGARIANMSYSAPVPWYLGWSVLPFEAAELVRPGQQPGGRVDARHAHATRHDERLGRALAMGRAHHIDPDGKRALAAALVAPEWAMVVVPDPHAGGGGQQAMQGGRSTGGAARSAQG